MNHIPFWVYPIIGSFIAIAVGAALLMVFTVMDVLFKHRRDR